MKKAEPPQALLELLGYLHDINNALIPALLSGEVLSALPLRCSALSEEQLGQLIYGMQRSLSRTRQLLEEVRRSGARLGDLAVEPVEIAGVLSEVLDATARRFPGVELSSSAGPLWARVCGGASGLGRVLENLLVNACQGDGSRGARRVEISITASPAGVEIVIQDDGPGFPPGQLQLPPGEARTSKPDGAGLGLFTSACLIRASGGSLLCANAPEGGARVSVLLPPYEAPAAP